MAHTIEMVHLKSSRGLDMRDACGLNMRDACEMHARCMRDACEIQLDFVLVGVGLWNDYIISTGLRCAERSFGE